MKKISRTLTGVLSSCALFAFPLAAVFVAHPAVAQSGAMSGPLLRQKLAAIKASTAENQRNLHQYTWTETSRITLNGDAKPPREFSCSYGPDGKVRKVPLGAPSESAQSGGRFRQRIVEKKTAEMKDYMQQVGRVFALYMPPNPQKMQQAFERQKVTMHRSNGTTELEFRDYALPGDSMTMSIDQATKKMHTLSVHSYLDSPSDAVSLRVEFSTLPDGTNYPLRTTIDAQAKKINVVNTNTNYRKAVQ